MNLLSILLFLWNLGLGCKSLWAAKGSLCPMPILRIKTLTLLRNLSPALDPLFLPLPRKKLTNLRQILAFLIPNLRLILTLFPTNPKKILQPKNKAKITLKGISSNKIISPLSKSIPNPNPKKKKARAKKSKYKTNPKPHPFFVEAEVAPYAASFANIPSISCQTPIIKPTEPFSPFTAPIKINDSPNLDPPIKDDVIKGMTENEVLDRESIENFVPETQDPLYLNNDEDGMLTVSNKGDQVLMEQ